MRGMIGIAGTPGTGKKTVAPIVAKAMGLPAPIPVNSLAKRGGDVDTALLRRRLRELDPPPGVIFGHLLPHVLVKREAAFVAVLRCEPAALRVRLQKRGYTPAQVAENTEAELIGVVLDECVRKFGTSLVREYDTTSAPPEKVATALARDASAAVRSGPSTPTRPWIDWTLRYDSSTKLRSLLDAGRGPPAST